MLTQTKIEQIIEALPHGSGIDGKWEHEQLGRRHFFRNSFHLMDEHGYYCGWQDFQVIVFQHDRHKVNPLKGPLEGQVQIVHAKGDLDWDLEFRGGTRYQAKKSDLRQYLSDLFAEVMHDLGLNPPHRGHVSQEKLQERLALAVAEKELVGELPPKGERKEPPKEHVLAAEPRPLFAVKRGLWYEVYAEEDKEMKQVLGKIDVDTFPDNHKDAVAALEKQLGGVIENFNKEDGKFYP